MSIEKLKELVRESNSIVFFGGAGTSTESNIPDFRSESGLYKTSSGYSYPPELMLSHTFFVNNTEEFYSFYRSKMIYKDAKPNMTHYALTKMENEGKLKAILTQNIDGLHQMAGSTNVLEIHGSIHRNYCLNCGKKFDLNYIINSPAIVPKCDACKGIVRPDVVLYEEQLNMEVWNKAIHYVSNADVLIIGGTSLVVYPAASLLEYYNGNKLVLINKSSTPYDNRAALAINDSIGKVFNSLMDM
jgi:NAD-dependent deacetylase